MTSTWQSPKSCSPLELNLAQISVRSQHKSFTVAPSPPPRNGQTRINLCLTDQDVRDTLRWILVGPADFTQKAEYMGKPFPLWTTPPKYVTARNTKLFNKANIIATQMGLNWRNDLFIDTKDTRTITLKENGTILAIQDQDTWEVEPVKSDKMGW